MAENNFGLTMESLFKGMDGFITTKTVVGDAIHFEDGTIILPLVDVTFGAGAGAFSKEADKKNNGVGALSGKITPSSVLVVKDGNVKLVNIKNQDTVTKLLDMVPDFVNKFAPGKKQTKEAETEATEVTEEDIAEKLEKEQK
ncbi:MAG: sporulation protein [Lachnospiraceae bacterium]|jgi:uncharacterized spore protein YtfJ|nr:sporulation protein [Lachnospiraceae bacterium]MCX4316054.1 GerW family sporulation protein [Lachnospiraceae bacterium]